MLENLVYLTLWFVVFGAGPATTLLGVAGKNLGTVSLGCVLSWGALFFVLTTGAIVAFNILSLVPVFLNA